MWFMTTKPQFQIRQFASLDDMKADEYAYWRTQSAHARMDAVTEITTTAFIVNQSMPRVPRLQRTLQRIER